VQVVTLLLLVAALGCLIVGLMTSSTVWIVASLVASVLAVLAIRGVRRRAEAAPARRDQAELEAELVRPTGAREEIAALAAQTAAERSAAQAASEADPTPGEIVSSAPPQPAARPKRVAVVPGHGTLRLAAVSSSPDADELPPHTTAADLLVGQPPSDEVAVGDDDDSIDEPAPANTHAPLNEKGSEHVWVIDGRPRYHLSSCGFLVGQRSEPIPLQQAVEDGFSPCSQCDPDTALVSG
jgi:hypothetical protein